jgi:hypothetical protein
MSMRCQGWLFAVPSTLSISFFPAERSCLAAEHMPWQSLFNNELRMRQFLSGVNAAEIPVAAGCLCFYIDCDEEQLKEAFEQTRTGKTIMQVDG